jgi:acyl-CoA synthetase (AMP-forming)/AMP-acid ligase II
MTEPERDVPPTIAAALARAIERYGDTEALVTPDVRLTYAELGARVTHAARSLIGRGIEHGDRVAIWAPNSPEWAIASLAIHSVGAVLVPVNTRFKGGEARYVLETAGVRLLLTVTDFLGTDYLAVLREVQPVDGLEAIELPSLTDGVPPLPPGAELERAGALTGSDLCEIMFTSGTTGAPKGAMLRHGATTRVFTTWADCVGLRSGDRYLVVNPFFHTFGLKAGILACILTGATMIPMPTLDLAVALATIDRERVTTMPGAPTLYQTMLDHPDLSRYDLSSLRLAVTGAATVPVELIRRMRAELTFETIVTGYGLTESTGVVTMSRHDDDVETIATTSGRAIPGVEVRVVDADGNPRPPGEPGEVVVRGYNVMAGYYGDPDATAAAIDTDRWLHTGDVGVLDEWGNLRVTDRTKDMFIVGGFNAYPAEIENMIMRHPAVAQVAVIGVPDERLGEVGMAFVVPRRSATIEPDELVAWCRAEMANYKVPRHVRIVDGLPLNAAGKVLKFQLRNEAVAGR